MTVKRRIGIMGGTFNPIHMGHLIIAEEAREKFVLEKVVFIPSYITPNKEVEAAPAEERLRMVELAVESNPYFSVSDMEIRQKGMSYTVSTLRTLKERYGDDWELYFYFRNRRSSESSTVVSTGTDFNLMPLHRGCQTRRNTKG